MDIVDQIRDDRVQIQNLMSKIVATREDEIEEREAFFTEMRSLLEAHCNSEERALYLRVDDLEEFESEMPDYYERNEGILTLLQALSEMEYGNPAWVSKFAILQDNINEHWEIEEGDLLPILPQFFTDDQREEMADDMKSLEDEILSAGPSLVTQTPAQTIISTNA